ncbi:MAG: ATP-binding cassette domain-containing protein [Alphaproteobacteria bacterium]|nr:ATP-binding cassette domain-containing protein [Alphaproteobacteria bacterium]MDE2109914.1 ATP-binding cassette domain-containing protein [Alphaproteobacteria bacterium]MDE2492657.1 ATP-binding cassette domain-containing protein [Alphaproteobacteria bacterium]
MHEPAIELKGVTKRFGDLTAVDRLDLALPRGGILGFLGPNGAGKTTSLRILLGLYSPDAGEARVLGRRVEEVRSRIGYLPEERGLYKRARADDAIAYVAALKGMNRHAALKRARELLGKFGLGRFARVRIEGLSKGMAQKVQLLAAVAHDPDLVILDEPFVGLDPVNQGELEDFIRALARDGKTILFSTHTMEHAERLCDRFVVLVRGRKRFDGTLSEARMQLSRRARIGAEGDIGFLTTVENVVLVTPPGADREFWEIDLKEGADGRELLAACFARGIVPFHFDLAPPSLHDIFVALVAKANVS